jgi:hypothetical protein
MGIGLRSWRWTLFFRFSSPSSCSCHISVSGQYCPIYRRVPEKQVKRYYPTKHSETNVRSNFETTGLQNICGDNTSDETMFTFLKVRHFFLGFVVTVVFSPRTFFHQLHIVPTDVCRYDRFVTAHLVSADV